MLINTHIREQVIADLKAALAFDEFETYFATDVPQLDPSSELPSVSAHISTGDVVDGDLDFSLQPFGARLFVTIYMDAADEDSLLDAKAQKVRSILSDSYSAENLLDDFSLSSFAYGRSSELPYATFTFTFNIKYPQE